MIVLLCILDLRFDVKLNSEISFSFKGVGKVAVSIKGKLEQEQWKLIKQISVDRWKPCDLGISTTSALHSTLDEQLSWRRRQTETT